MNIADVVQIELKLDKLPIIIGFDQGKFLARLFELGHDYFNENRVYALLFDTTPTEKVKSEMLNYNLVVDAFPNDRVYDRAVYIGNFEEKDHMTLAEQITSAWGHEIIEVTK